MSNILKRGSVIQSENFYTVPISSPKVNIIEQELEESEENNVEENQANFSGNVIKSPGNNINSSGTNKKHNNKLKNGVENNTCNKNSKSGKNNSSNNSKMKEAEIYSRNEINRQREREAEQREFIRKERLRQQNELKDLADKIIKEYDNKAQERTAELIGEEIISRAQKTAELIIEHTLENAKAELNSVLEQGYAEGFMQGKNEATAILEPALNKIQALARAITRVQDDMLANFKDGIFSIISEISSKIIHREVSAGDEYLIDLYQDAIKSIKPEEFVTVTVSESQINFVTHNLDLFKAAISGIEDFKVIAEKDALEGTMIVESERTIADSSYYVQEEKIDAALLQMRETLVIPQSAEEIEALINAKNDVLNLDLINNSEDYENYDDNSENAENMGSLEDLESGNGENDSEDFIKFENYAV